MFPKERLDVPGENTARGKLLPITGLGEKWLAVQLVTGLLDRVFERKVLERVQRVVVNEDADRPLRR